MALSPMPEIYTWVRFAAIELGTPQAEQHNSFHRSDNPQGLCCINAPGLNPSAGEEIRHSVSREGGELHFYSPAVQGGEYLCNKA